MIDCPVAVVIVLCPWRPTLLTRIVDEEDNLKLDSAPQCQELPEEVAPQRLTTSVSPLNLLPALEI